jgi:Fuc2NAc and GlcNAc transferase
MYILYFSSLAIVFCCAALMTKMMLEKEIFHRDVPNSRSMHQAITPRGGGLAIIIASVVGFLLVTLCTSSYFQDYLFWCVGPLLAVTAIGWLDDRKDQSIAIRLGVQCTAAMVVSYVVLDHSGNFSNVNLLFIAAFIFASFVIVWYINLFNFMDGLDGIASCQSIIVCLTFAYWFWSANAYPLALLSGLTGAASGGFLIFNWSPAKVFMGDVGSLSLGFLMGTFSLCATLLFDIPLVASLVIMAVFLFDATYTLLKRMLTKQKWWRAHRSHLYQRAANFMNHRSIVMVTVMINLCLSIVATWYISERKFGVLLLLFVVAALYCLALLIEKKDSTAVATN